MKQDLYWIMGLRMMEVIDIDSRTKNTQGDFGQREASGLRSICGMLRFAPRMKSLSI